MKPKFCPSCATPLAARTVDDKERLACSCGYVFWNNPTPVVAGFVVVGDQVVLARNARWPEGWFSMITGFLEAGERPEDAILRETNEELGLSGRRCALIGHYPFVAFNQIIIAYLVEAEGEVTLGDELAEIRWVPRAALAQHDFGPLTLTADIVRDLCAR